MQVKTLLILFFGSISFFIGNASAQDIKEGKKQKKEIIIREGSDSSQKMVVIVDGDKITVNGKEYTGDQKNEFIIKRRKNGTMFPDAYLMEEKPGFFDQEESEDIKRASLGVLAGKNEKGAIILEVLPGSPAEKAGLKQNDLIISVAGKKITGPEELSEAIKAKNPSDKVEIQYLRDGKTNSTHATLEARKAISKTMTIQLPNNMNRNFLFDDMIEDEMVRNGINGKMHGPQPKLGIEIQELEEGNGVKIIDVEQGSSADKSGLKTGDIILSIEQEKIANVSDVKSAIRSEKRNLNFDLLRDGKSLQLEVKLPKILKKAKL